MSLEASEKTSRLLFRRRKAGRVKRRWGWRGRETEAPFSPVLGMSCQALGAPRVLSPSQGPEHPWKKLRDCHHAEDKGWRGTERR